MKLSYGYPEAQDLEGLKKLWKLAFHDEDEYIDHFFRRYSPKQMFLVKSEGEIIGMTYYFPSLLHRKGKAYTFAYLYGVATHPEMEKRGIASGLLSYIYSTLEKEGFDGVTTVPATPSLHGFFGKNGFSDYFVYEKKEGLSLSGEVERISGGEFAQRREDILQNQDMPYITLQEDGFAYQEGVCALGKGGFFRKGDDVFCVEQGGEDVMIVKEAFGENPPDVALSMLESRFLPQKITGDEVNFGMIQWFSSCPEDWAEGERGYLGLAFD
ncbi:MAG: GNAT family N-acetyltransferase [Eubacteriales bacterium]